MLLLLVKCSIRFPVKITVLLTHLPQTSVGLMAKVLFAIEKLLNCGYDPSVPAVLLSRFGALNSKPTGPGCWLPPPPDLLSALIFCLSANGQHWVDDITS